MGMMMVMMMVMMMMMGMMMGMMCRSHLHWPTCDHTYSVSCALGVRYDDVGDDDGNDTYDLRESLAVSLGCHFLQCQLRLVRE